MSETPAGSSVQPLPAPPPPTWREVPGLLLQMLRAPACAFGRLRQDRWTWIAPALIVALCMTLPAHTLLRSLYADYQRTVIERYVERGVLTEEQAHETLQRVEVEGAERGAVTAGLQIAVGAVYQVALRIVLPAALLLAGVAFVMETRTRFAPVLAAVSYAALPAALREILRTPLRAVKGSLDVFFSPAALTGRDTVGGFALDLLDLFDVWVLALLIVGLAAISGIPRGRSAALVLPLWAVYSLLKLALRVSPFGAAIG
jgi:hypothetical protein